MSFGSFALTRPAVAAALALSLVRPRRRWRVVDLALGEHVGRDGMPGGGNPLRPALPILALLALDACESHDLSQYPDELSRTWAVAKVRAPLCPG